MTCLFAQPGLWGTNLWTQLESPLFVVLKPSSKIKIMYQIIAKEKLVNFMPKHTYTHQTKNTPNF